MGPLVIPGRTSGVCRDEGGAASDGGEWGAFAECGRQEREVRDWDLPGNQRQVGPGSCGTASARRAGTEAGGWLAAEVGGNRDPGFRGLLRMRGRGLAEAPSPGIVSGSEEPGLGREQPGGVGSEAWGGIRGGPSPHRRSGCKAVCKRCQLTGRLLVGVVFVGSKGPAHSGLGGMRVCVTPDLSISQKKPEIWASVWHVLIFQIGRQSESVKTSL